MVIGGALIGVAQVEQERLVEWTPEDLESDGQVLFREPAGHGERWQPR